MRNWKPRDVKIFRSKLKLTQKDFGNLLGVSRIHIYYLENGLKASSKTLRLLLDCLKEKFKKKGSME